MFHIFLPDKKTLQRILNSPYIEKLKIQNCSCQESNFNSVNIHVHCTYLLSDLVLQVQAFTHYASVVTFKTLGKNVTYLLFALKLNNGPILSHMKKHGKHFTAYFVEMGGGG